MALETEFPELQTNAAPRPAADAPFWHRLGLRSPYMIALYVILILAVIVSLIPFIYVISTSLKESKSLFKYPPEWFPANPTLINYQKLLTENPFPRWVLNSVIVAGSVTVIKVIIDSMAGYAFAKLRFPGRDGLFMLVLITLMVPFAATLIPLYLIIRNMGLLNTYPGLILPALASPIGIFMMRSFVESLPSDLENAARLDGCSEFGIFRRIILPLIRPGLIVLGIFTFMQQWTSYLWPLVVATNPDMRTVTVGAQSLRSLFTIDWGVLSAASIMSMLPLVIVFIFLQRYFIAGSIAGALKE